MDNRHTRVAATRFRETNNSSDMEVEVDPVSSLGCHMVLMAGHPFTDDTPTSRIDPDRP